MWWLVLLAVGAGAQPTLTWGTTVTNVARGVFDNDLGDLRRHMCFQTYNNGQNWIVAWLDASNAVRWTTASANCTFSGPGTVLQSMDAWYYAVSCPMNYIVITPVYQSASNGAAQSGDMMAYFYRVNDTTGTPVYEQTATLTGTTMDGIRSPAWSNALRTIGFAHRLTFCALRAFGGTEVATPFVNISCTTAGATNSRMWGENRILLRGASTYFLWVSTDTNSRVYQFVDATGSISLTSATTPSQAAQLAMPITLGPNGAYLVSPKMWQFNLYFSTQPINGSLAVGPVYGYYLLKSGSSIPSAYFATSELLGSRMFYLNPYNSTLSFTDMDAIGNVTGGLQNGTITNLNAFGLSASTNRLSPVHCPADPRAMVIIGGNEDTAQFAYIDTPLDPTPAPTATPTAAPTATPTATPSAVPTAVPMALPTAAPSAGPTVQPTANPTAQPTSTPTAQPTVSPTAAPTAQPTAAPTADPSAAPTAVPSALPSATPTATPTSNPTPNPSAAPTAQPTATPTAQPTAEPSASPTSAPTAAPSAAPTEMPTWMPSTPPTAAPTGAPSPDPTTAPSAAPSFAPTSVSTASPTASPTALPTSVPTSAPTSVSTALTPAPTPLPTNEATWSVIGSANSQVLDLSLVRPTAAEPEVRVGVRSSFRYDAGLRNLRPDLFTLVANVSFRPLDVTPSAIAPPNRVSTDITFDLSLSDPGALSFPIVLDFTRPTATPYYRKGRANYLSVGGRWVRASNYSCEAFASLRPYLPADTVTDERTILRTFICHNTEFAIFQQPESSGCSSFVRACNLCVPERTGCDCRTTGTFMGFSNDARAIAMAILLALASTVAVGLEVWLRRQSDDSYAKLLDADAPADIIPVPRAAYVSGFAAVLVFAIAGSVLVHTAEGHPHTPDTSQVAYAWILTAVVAARFVAFFLHRELWGQSLATAAEATSVLWWMLPSATVVAYHTDEDPQTSAIATFVLGVALAIWLFVERLSVLRWQENHSGVAFAAHLVALGLRLVVWWRVSCE